MHLKFAYLLLCRILLDTRMIQNLNGKERNALLRKVGFLVKGIPFGAWYELFLCQLLKCLVCQNQVIDMG